MNGDLSVISKFLNGDLCIILLYPNGDLRYTRIREADLYGKHCF